MKKIAVYNNKGGIAKTVTAVNFAYNLSEAGHRVLLLDMDPQGNASSFFRRYDLNKASVKELLTGEQAPSRCVRRTPYKGLDIVPSNLHLREVVPERLADGLETLESVGFVYDSRYEYCILDCPPSVDFLVEVILRAVDDVVIPLKADRFSADGLGTVLDLIGEFGSKTVTAGCLFTQFYRNRDSLQTVQEILETQSVRVYENVIRRCSAVDHSLSVKRPLARCASRSNAALDYRDFTKEYLRKERDDGAA